MLPAPSRSVAFQAGPLDPYADHMLAERVIATITTRGSSQPVLSGEVGEEGAEGEAAAEAGEAAGEAAGAEADEAGAADKDSPMEDVNDPAGDAVGDAAGGGAVESEGEGTMQLHLVKWKGLGYESCTWEVSAAGSEPTPHTARSEPAPLTAPVPVRVLSPRDACDTQFGTRTHLRRKSTPKRAAMIWLRPSQPSRGDWGHSRQSWRTGGSE